MTGEGEVKKFLLAGFAFAALAGPAAAADMPLKAPAPVAVDIWTGGYVGANVGYGWGDDTIRSAGAANPCSSAAGGCVVGPNTYGILSAQLATLSTTVNRSGVTYGGQAGHNWLVHNIFWNYDGVIGVEVDYQGVSDSHSTSLTGSASTPAFPGFPLSQTATFTEKMNTFGTVRGRFGFLWGQNTLVYATGGVAFANMQATSSFSQNLVSPGVGPYSAAGSTNQEMFGPTVGGGIEWKWTRNWSVKAEYLYADFRELNINTNALISPLAGTIFSSANVQTSSHVHENIARLGTRSGEMI
jgi:outer membrane immunogenic protein